LTTHIAIPSQRIYGAEVLVAIEVPLTALGGNLSLRFTTPADVVAAEYFITVNQTEAFAFSKVAYL
jgi:hypothetical protein